jgi:chromosomal replication initiation ATPase DnaA
MNNTVTTVGNMTKRYKNADVPVVDNISFQQEKENLHEQRKNVFF